MPCLPPHGLFGDRQPSHADSWKGALCCVLCGKFCRSLKYLIYHRRVVHDLKTPGHRGKKPLRRRRRAAQQWRLRQQAESPHLT